METKLRNRINQEEGCFNQDCQFKGIQTVLYKRRGSVSGNMINGPSEQGNAVETLTSLTSLQNLYVG